MPEIQHPRDALQEALDGRLDARQAGDLERHLAVCDECRRELELLRWTKAQAAAARALVTGPPDLEARVRQALDVADTAAIGTSGVELREPSAGARRDRSRRWTLAGLAAAAGLLLAVWALDRIARPTLPDHVAGDYWAYRAGQLRLAVQTGDVTQIEAYFRREGLSFRTRVFDLGMMRYDALGGLAHRLDQRPSALFVYRGPDGRSLLCQMYEGLTTELPAPTRRLTHKGVEFLVYDKDGLTLVFWQERDGDVTCVLAGDGDPQAVIDLAFAKAVEL